MDASVTAHELGFLVFVSKFCYSELACRKLTNVKMLMLSASSVFLNCWYGISHFAPDEPGYTYCFLLNILLCIPLSLETYGFLCRLQKLHVYYNYGIDYHNPLTRKSTHHE